MYVPQVPKDLDQIINDYPESLDRILLNTDSGSRFNEDLYRAYRAGAFPADIQRQLFRENALNFFKLNA